VNSKDIQVTLLNREMGVWNYHRSMSSASTTVESVAQRIARCRIVQEKWRERSIRDRLRPVRALRRFLVEECDSICEAVAKDVHKSAEEAIGGDILPLADALKFLEQQAGKLLKPRTVPRRQLPVWLWPQRDIVHRRPRGIVGIIGTWNYPVFLNGVHLAQALTAGNGVIWKPSEVAPASAAALHSLILRAGYPADLVQVLDSRREMGRELAEGDVDHIVFTGSSTTGQALAATLGRRLVSSSLELSGCDAMFILEDADIPLAARAAWFGATANRGQTCIAVRRAFVQRSVYPQFLAALELLAAGAAPVPQALSAQVEQAEQLVHEAVADGGRLLTPKPPALDGTMCVPMIVADARPDMALCREATFAPLMAVLPYDTMDEAVRMNRQCPYGLGASIFTRRPRFAAELAKGIRAGMITVNDVIAPTVHPATPFGGMGRSGWGVTQGAEGLLEMTVPQVVTTRGGRFRPHYDMSAGSNVGHGELVRGILNFSHATSLRERIKGMWHVLRAAWRGN
jgi:acyl-CoA reductase-like NAD-dependent aldehyde dehydrogenase